MTYDWSRFSITFFYYAPLDRVFRAWATPGGLESFYIRECLSVRDKDELFHAGDDYRFRYVHDFGHDGNILAVRENERLAFTFGEMEVEVAFSELKGGGGTKVVLRQTGIEDKVMSHMNCRSCWLYFMTNLKSVLEHGIDLRDHDHPDRASSMEVGYPAA